MDRIWTLSFEKDEAGFIHCTRWVLHCRNFEAQYGRMNLRASLAEALILRRCRHVLTPCDAEPTARNGQIIVGGRIQLIMDKAIFHFDVSKFVQYVARPCCRVDILKQRCFESLPRSLAVCR